MVAPGPASRSRELSRRARVAPRSSRRSGSAPAGGSGAGVAGRVRPVRGPGRGAARSRGRPGRPTPTTDEDDARPLRARCGRSGGVTDVRGRHHDHEVRRQPPRPVRAARLPVREVGGAHHHRERRCATRGTRRSRRSGGCRETFTVGSRRRGAVVGLAPARPAPSSPGRRRRAAGRARPGRSTSPRPGTPRRRAPGPSAPRPARRPKHSDCVPACGVDDDRLVAQRRDRRGVRAPRRCSSRSAARRRGPAPARRAGGPGSRRRAPSPRSSTPCSSGRRAAAGSGRRGRSPSIVR